MKSTGDTATLTIPSALLAELKAVAVQEHRAVVEMARDFIARGLSELQQARELGLPDDGQPLGAEYRQIIGEKIAQGLASARKGRLLDGESIFARIDEEMAELDRQRA